MERFGKYNNLTQDVIDFVEQGSILSAQSTPSLDFPALFISDFEQAQELAWGQAGAQLTWVDVREKAASEVMAVRYQIADFAGVDDELGTLVDKFHSILRRKLRGQHAELLDDVAGDLFNSAYARAVFGKTDGLFEKMYQAYKAGYWPCGWDGDYPKGLLILYNPKS